MKKKPEIILQSQEKRLTALMVAMFKYYMSPGISPRLRNKLEAVMPMLRKELERIRLHRRATAHDPGEPP